MKEIKLKPIYIIQEPGVSPNHVRVVAGAIEEVLKIANVTNGQIRIVDLGVWRAKHWREGEKLIPHCSVDWYLRIGRDASQHPGQLSSFVISQGLFEDPAQREKAHYDVMILMSDLGAERCDFIVGRSARLWFAMISVRRFLGLSRRSQEECIKTVAMHEIGHMFGLVGEHRRGKGAEEAVIGLHCTDRCVMRQGFVVPRDFLNITEDRLRYGPFCDTCIAELRQFFA